MKNKYDVIIIGSGIGGLVCACYLAKANLKVGVFEQQDKVGGYIGSFSINGFNFDIGAHYFGGINKGFLGSILEELDVLKELSFFQADHSDRLFFDDLNIDIFSDFGRTIEELKKSFVSEATNIDEFFRFINQKDVFDIYKKSKNYNFRDFLKSFFKNQFLLAFFERTIFNSLGTCAADIPAWIGIEVWKEFYCDAGNYILGGNQMIANVLARKAADCGADIFLNHKVCKLVVDKTKSRGIVLEEGRQVLSNFIVSDIDPFQLSLLVNQNIEKLFNNYHFKPTPSAVVLYLGYSSSKNSINNYPQTHWIMPNNKSFCLLKSHMKNYGIENEILIFSPSFFNRDKNLTKISIQVFSLVSQENFETVENNKERIGNYFKECVHKIFPFLDGQVLVEALATPKTFLNRSSNSFSSILGKQLDFNFTRKQFIYVTNGIENLFLVGAWYSHGGISQAAISARRIARLLMSETKKNTFL